MLTTTLPGASRRPYRLRLMGTTDLVDAHGDRVDEVLRQPKRLALLAYLCCEDPGGIHPRDRLLALFWSERPDGAARGALNQSLYALRGVLGKEVIVSLGQAGVGLVPETVTCDVAHLLSVLERSAGHLDDDQRRALEDALALYEGDLLEGVYPPGADGFMEWLDRIRARVRQDVIAAHLKLARQNEEADELASALLHAQRASGLSPFNEEAHRRLLQAYLAIGDRGEALRAHQEYAALLAREFGTGPAADTVRWVDALFAKYPAPPPRAGRVGEDEAPADRSEWRLEQDPKSRRLETRSFGRAVDCRVSAVRVVDRRLRDRTAQ